MKWLKKIALNMVLPKVKKFVLGYIESEEWQRKLTTRLNEKLDIPRIGEKTEAKIINQMYDAGQELAVELIESFDVDSLVDKAL